jgi:hypothetical protein
VNSHWVSFALAIAAGAIGYSGHDGWDWYLLVIALIELMQMGKGVSI